MISETPKMITKEEDLGKEERLGLTYEVNIALEAQPNMMDICTTQPTSTNKEEPL